MNVAEPGNTIAPMLRYETPANYTGKPRVLSVLACVLWTVGGIPFVVIGLAVSFLAIIVEQRLKQTLGMFSVGIATFFIGFFMIQLPLRIRRNQTLRKRIWQDGHRAVDGHD